MSDEEMLHRFGYHPPQTPERGEEHKRVRAGCLSLALFLDRVLPEGREKSSAISRLEEVMFWANAAVARQRD